MLGWCRLNDILIYIRKKEENSSVKSCASPIASNKRGKEKYGNINPYMTVQRK